MTLSTRNFIGSLIIGLGAGFALVSVHRYFRDPLDRVESVLKDERVSMVILMKRDGKPLPPQLRMVVAEIFKRQSPFQADIVFEDEQPIVYRKLKESGEVVEVKP